MSFKVAVVQDSPVLFNLHSTIEKVELLTKKAVNEGAKLIVFPEAFVSAYPKGLDFGARIGSRSTKGREEFLDYYNSSLELNSKEFFKLLNIAKENKVFIVIGVIEKDMGTYIAPCCIFPIKVSCFVNIERLCLLLLKG